MTQQHYDRPQEEKLEWVYLFAKNDRVSYEAPRLPRLAADQSATLHMLVAVDARRIINFSFMSIAETAVIYVNVYWDNVFENIGVAKIVIGVTNAIYCFKYKL